MKRVKNFINFINESDDKDLKDRDREQTNWSQYWELSGYQKLFKSELNKRGYSMDEFGEMSKEEKRDFFLTLDKKWEADNE